MNTKVKFTVPAEVVSDATEGVLLGEFNNWDPAQGIALKKKKDGSLSTEVELEAGQTYQYRYLLNDGRWVNDKNTSAWSEVYGQHVENNIVSVPVAVEKPAAKAKPEVETAPVIDKKSAIVKKAAPKKAAAKKAAPAKSTEAKPSVKKTAPNKA